VTAQVHMRSYSPKDTLNSTQILGDGIVVFRIYAPKAESVTMSGDLAEYTPAKMTMNADGIWEIVMSGIEPGVYRYSFNVDGVSTIDPKSAQAIETYSLLNYTPSGDEFFALQNVPHGAVSERYYYSNASRSIRRLYLWTPHGFEKMNSKLPVLYLLHGGGDNDRGWPLLGAAGLILDNLYANDKISPMIVVMPDGHIDTEVFVDDLCENIVPFIESTYDVYTDPAHRALSGLSNGGIQTMNVILKQHEMFDWYIVLSSGWFAGTDAFEKNAAKLPSIAQDFNNHVKLLIFTQGGPEDIAFKNGQETVRAFKESGFYCEYFEAPGGHTWFTWRYNLRDLTPRLFK
ncbi:MAG: alpha/beta hydrolase-fold protein, partial [Synergistaceae bacterium]|nr:alpha/beta hydrolase-fold protein [Synergistaceae bacterium]